MTEIAGVHGPEYGEIRAGLTDPTARAVAARPDGSGGIVAYGELGTGFSVPGDKTIACRVMVPNAGYVKFWEVANMRLGMIPSGSGWKPSAYVVTPEGEATVLGDEIAESSTVAVDLAATYDASTGTLELFVDNVAVNDTSFGEARNTSVGLPIWQTGAAADGWITDAGLWDEVLVFATNPSVTINQGGSQSDPVTDGSNVVFDVVFSESVTGFSTGDVTLSGTAGATTAVVSGSGASYTVTVSGMTSNGTVIASIGSSVCVSSTTGLPNDASTSSDNTVTWSSPTVGALPTAILALSPLSYWTLRGNDANTLNDFGSLGHDLTNTTSISLNTTAGGDGFNYPLGPSGSHHLLGADDIAYEPQNASGLTVMCLLKEPAGGTGGGLANAIVKSDSAGAGSWNYLHNWQNARVQTITAASGLARRRTFQPMASNGETNWRLIILRFSSSATGFPTARSQGANVTGTTTGSGSGNANSSQPIRLFSHGGITGPFEGSLAHVAIFAGQLSDLQCAAIETAATSDGWTI